ncbi:MAG: redoxin domain-containing protein [Chloroflexi bacterium]|nr:redoxin domain-containing protein [Chloroflexota bacterium]MBP8057915.1 redoxin domain-containing protein [Chloroflexota bacterium]
MEQSHEKFAAAGLRIIAVGLGEPKHARHFCGKLAPSLVCHVDQNEKAYKQYGLTEFGLWGIANPALYVASMRAMTSGHLQGEATGNTKMLPGTFVVDEEGVIQFAHYSAHAGDHPDINQLLKVMKSTP